MPSGARDRRFTRQTVRGFALILGLALFGGTPATAGLLTVEFDFASGSSLSILGGAINTPPDGTITSGFGRLRVEATSATTPTVGGPAEFADARLAGTVNKNIQGQALVTGGFSFAQTAPAPGTLSAANTITLGGSLSANLNANIACTGAGCSLLGLPINEAGVFLFPLQPLPIQNLDTPGSAFIDFLIPVSLDGVQAVFHLVGVETARSYLIPEPGTAALLGLGLAALAARRRNTEASPRVA